MQVFEGRYFDLNRRFLIFVGIWPYDYEGKTLKKTLSTSILFILSIPQLMSVILYDGNIDKLMLCVLMFLIMIITWMKMMQLVITEDNMKKMCQSIADNWLAIQDENEREILNKFSEIGRNLTIFYTVNFVSFGTLIALLPLIPKIIDILIPLEEPRPNMFALQGEFFIDRDEYFFIIFLCDACIVSIVTIANIAMDTMYIASNLQCCALYGIAGYRSQNLKRISSDAPHNLSNTEDTDDSYSWMIHTIELHQHALSFTSTLNDAYSKGYFVQVTSFILVIPLSSCAIMANLDNLLNAFPYVAVILALTIGLVVVCWPGQMVLDEQFKLSDASYCNQWYTTSIGTKKLLRIFMLRCSQPRILTAGGILLINFETFSKISRTAISYITVLASFR